MPSNTVKCRKMPSNAVKCRKMPFSHFVQLILECRLHWLSSRNWGADVCVYNYRIIKILANRHFSHFVQWILECTDFWEETEARILSQPTSPDLDAVEDLISGELWQCVAVCYRVLQCLAVQCAAVCCSACRVSRSRLLRLIWMRWRTWSWVRCRSVLQRVAACCSAVCCSMLQYALSLA